MPAPEHHLNCLQLEKFHSPRRPMPDLQRVSFYRVIDFLYYSCTTDLVLSLKLIALLLAEVFGLPITRAIVNSLVAAMTCKFMQNRHEGWYFRTLRTSDRSN